MKLASFFRSVALAAALPVAASAQVAAVAPSEPAPAEGVRIGPEGPVLPTPKAGEPRPNEPRVYKVAVTPSAVEPTPPLRYRFVASSADLKPGNSVPFLYRAIVGLGGENGERDRKFVEGYDRFSELPLDQLPKDEVRSLLAGYGHIFKELERAAEREQTDWSWRLGELTGTEAIAFLLPEIQQSRQLARLLNLKARLEIAEGRYDDAAATLRVGYRLGRDVAEPPTLINDLVGIAIDSILHGAVMELIAKNGSPNLYWALSTLPSPVIDLTPAMEYEMNLPGRFVPWLLDPEAADRTSRQWRDAFLEAVAEFGRVNGMNVDPGDAEGRLVASLGVTGLALRSYGPAKRRLIESGRDPAEVEAMPVGEVLAVVEKQVLDEVSQELLKGFYLAPPASRVALERAEDDLKRRGMFGSTWSTAEPLPFGSVLFPSLTAGLRAQTRLDARTAGLRAVEAVRMHAATTGALPKSLAEIEVVPVPADPLTGEPFPYRLDGETATLDMVVAPDAPQANWRIEFTLKK